METFFEFFQDCLNFKTLDTNYQLELSENQNCGKCNFNTVAYIIEGKTLTHIL